MRIVVLGGGAVGTMVARRLAQERNEVVIVEQRSDRCELLEESLDAKIVQGNASSIRTLEQAGIREAEMLIAVTSSDEANILGCLVAQRHSNARIKVARLRTPEVHRWKEIFDSYRLNVDLIINPDQETADRILRVIGLPGISDVLEFAEGRVRLFGMNIDPDNWVVGKSMAELDRSSPPPNSLMAIVFRGRQTFVPRGGDRLQAGDHVYIVCPVAETEAVFRFMGVQVPKKVERVFIVGGKQLGVEAALRLERQGGQVKLFERDLERCRKISTLLKSTVVVHGDGTDERVLMENGVEGVDAYLALTPESEVNIIASLLSKRLGARKAVALVNRLDFLPMAQILGINSSFSTRVAAVDRILQFVRRGHVLSVTTFREEEAESIELLATPGSKYVGRSLREIHMPAGTVVGAVSRPSGDVFVPRGNAIIQSGDRVVFFCLESLVPYLESAFLTRGRR